MTKKIDNVTIGSDPELFLFNSVTRKFVSSIGIIPGVKGKASPMGNLGEGYGLQIDNVLAEFNIPPTTDKKAFVESISLAKGYISDYIHGIHPSLKIMCVAAGNFPSDQLQSKESQEFGCSVDYNAWTEEPNEKPKGEMTRLRTTGTHIHVGFDEPKTSVRLELIKAMDLFLGVPSVIIDPDTVRRKLYGKAGAFRLTSYGVEYRVLSGYFIRDERHMGWMFDQTLKAINFVNNNGIVDNSNNKIVNCINNCDKQAALDICSRYNLTLI